MLEIPFNPKVSSDQSFRVRLGGSIALIRLIWNGRSGFWTMSVSNEAGRTIRGLKVVPYWPLMAEFDGSGPISGDFFVLPLSRPNPNPLDYDTLGSEWGLLWASATEVSEWRFANGI